MPTRQEASFAEVHAALRRILHKYEGKGIEAKSDGPTEYVLVGAPTAASKGREVWFAGLKTGKAYVSFHLMPVYAYPDLLDGISPALKKRMQGKSCFNFVSPDATLFRELAALVDAGYKRYRAERFLR